MLDELMEYERNLDSESSGENDDDDIGRIRLVAIVGLSRSSGVKIRWRIR